MTSAIRRFKRCWCKPVPALPVSAFRFAMGVMALAFAYQLVIIIPDMYASSGIFTARELHEAHTAVPVDFLASTDSRVTLDAWAGILACFSVALAVGWRPRLSAFMCWLIVYAFQNREPFHEHGGDVLLRIGLFLLIFVAKPVAGSCGRKMVAAWPYRLMQVQLLTVYVATVVNKLGGQAWRDGQSVWFPAHDPDFMKGHLPFIDSVALCPAFTYGTLAAEALVPFLLITRYRWIGLVVGLGLHLGIDWVMNVPFFAPIILSYYLLFVADREYLRAWGWWQSARSAVVAAYHWCAVYRLLGKQMPGKRRYSFRPGQVARQTARVRGRR